QAMSLCDYAVDVCLKACTPSLASSKTACQTKPTASINMEKMSQSHLFSILTAVCASPLQSKQAPAIAVENSTPPPVKLHSPPSPQFCYNQPAPSSDVEFSDSEIDSDDSDYNWVSFDYPELTADQRLDYERLKAEADWICICCAASRQRGECGRHFLSDKSGRQVKVRFDQRLSEVHEIDSGPYEADAYRSARRDDYLSAKFSFQADVQRAERFLSRVLTKQHREQMWKYIAERTN
ncbi:hypothetical protein BOX15_Mlig029365g3, partial [Macrostomum lignano]